MTLDDASGEYTGFVLPYDTVIADIGELSATLGSLKAQRLLDHAFRTMPEPRKDRWRPVVAQILYSGLGGHGGVVTSMIRADSERRWRHTLCFAGIEPLLPTYAAMCEAEGVPFAYIRAIARKPWLSYLPVLNWIWRTKPDAVILHSPTQLPGVLPYCRIHRIPLLVVEHQSNDLKSRQDWIFSGVAMQFADAIVTLTPRHEAELAARLGKWFRRSKVTLIANGIDAAALGPAKPLSGGEDVPVRIGMAGRFSSTKRFDLLIDALSVLQRTTTRPWHLSLAGAGEQWDQIRAYAGTKVVDGISFEGMLTGNALADWYRGLDIYCHASDGETLSVSVLQAMASGVPVVGSDVDGISDLLAGNSACGILAGSQTGKGLAAAVMQLVEEPGKARLMALHARAEAVRSYDQRTSFTRYDALVRHLAKHRSAEI